MNLTAQVICVLLASSSYGQAPAFGIVSVEQESYVAHTAVHDWSGDGVFDVISTAGSKLSLAVGAGDGTFETSVLLDAVAGAGWLRLGDFTGDGVEDLVFSASSSTGSAMLVMLVADGTGGFTRVDFPALPAGQYTGGLELADVNQDGNLDVVVAVFVNTPGAPGILTTLLGDGAGNLVSSGLSIPLGVRTTSLLIEDFDNDGIDDVAVTSEGNDDLRVLLGDGLGGFALQSITRVNADPRTLAVADFDQDGALDLVVGFRVGSAISVLSGDGVGGFTSTDVQTGSNRWSVAAGDVDGDGWADLICATFGPTVCLNDQAGGFGPPVTSVLEAGFSLTVADVNSDGDIDLVVGDTTDGATVVLGDGSGSFAAHVTMPDSVVRIESVDLNGDGREDLVYSRNDTGTQVGLWVRLALGDGTYEPATFTNTNLQPYRTLFTDWNGDGNMDVLQLGAKFVVLSGAPVAQNLVALEGDGAGGLTLVDELTLPQFGYGLAVGDLNDDGVLDVLVSHGALVTRFEFGPGSGFGAPQATPYAASAGLLIADVVGSSRADVVSSTGLELMIYENDGSGVNLGLSASILTGGAIGDFTVLDLDADGALDLVTWGSVSMTAVLLAGPSPTLSTTTFLPTGLNYVTGVDFGDVDGDGLLDAAIGGVRPQMLHGEPGGFATWHGLHGAAKDVALCDANDDGFLELVVASDDLQVIENRAQTPDGVRAFGTGTAGCRGTQLALTNRPADLGATDFLYTCNQAPPNSIGLCAGSQNIIEAGASVLGITAHLNPAGPLFRLDVVFSDANGIGRFAEVVPSNPAFAGVTYARQFIWDWTGVGACSPSPLGWSTSRGVEITLQ